jgi:hypothetical protein
MLFSCGIARGSSDGLLARTSGQTSAAHAAREFLASQIGLQSLWGHPTSARLDRFLRALSTPDRPSIATSAILRAIPQ